MPQISCFLHFRHSVFSLRTITAVSDAAHLYHTSYVSLHISRSFRANSCVCVLPWNMELVPLECNTYKVTIIVTHETKLQENHTFCILAKILHKLLIK
jgi:hypothetical protein